MLNRNNPLQRKTGLKRGTKKLKHFTAKRARREAKLRPIKRAWMDPWTECWWCRRKGRLTIHHISKRSRGGDWDQPCNWFAACATCNSGPLDKSDRATMARALALKAKHDLDNFSLTKWLVIHGKSPHTPIIEDVLEAADSPALCELIKEVACNEL